MKWNVKKRLEFIESRLLWEGRISRKDLVEFFDISTPQATKDLKSYQEEASGNLYYDNRAKQYVATDSIDPVFVSKSSKSYLAQLLIALLEKTKDVFSCGTLPPAYSLPNPGRIVDEHTFKTVLQCVHTGNSIEIEYQSMNKSEPSWRWISPHALGFDGHRWHVRSLCHKSKQYRDFNLGRILSLGDTKEIPLDHSNDFLWNDTVTFRISTHPDLTESQKICIERDYSMVNGEAEIKIKAAFHFYLKERLKLTAGHKDNPAKEQQIILVNEDEVNTKIELLEEIANSRLKKLDLSE